MKAVAPRSLRTLSLFLLACALAACEGSGTSPDASAPVDASMSPDASTPVDASLPIDASPGCTIGAAVCEGSSAYRVCGHADGGIAPGEAIPCQAGTTCAGGECGGTCVVPEVLVVVDRSAALAASWSWIAASLADVLTAEQGRMNIGLRVTPAVNAGCAAGAIVPLAQNNATQLIAALSAPTGDADGAISLGLHDLVGAFGAANDGQYVLLLSAGGDACAMGDAVAEADALARAGVRTAVIDLGSGSALLDSIAAAGRTGAAVAAADQTALDAALQAFVIATRRCVCTADAKSCAANVWQVCSSDGTTLTSTPCAADGDQCTSDCDPAHGCNWLDTTLACDDSDACTLGDSCATGSCQGAPKVCSSPPPKTCTSPTSLRKYDAAGTCMPDGACEYAHTDTSCAGDCVPTGGLGDACYTWEPISVTDAPSPRWGARAVWTGKYVVVWGGYDKNGVLATGGRYDPVSDTWFPVSTVNAPPARGRHTMVWTGTEVIVWGGTDELTSEFADGARYNPTTDVWTPMTSVMAPTGRVDHAAGWTGSEMIVFGGSAAGGGRYDPALDQWTPTSTVGEPARRYAAIMQWTGSDFIVWGGCATTGCSTLLTDGARYHAATDTWIPLGTTGSPRTRAFASGVWTGSELIALGGDSSPGTGDRYNLATDSWAPTADSPSGRSGHAAVWTGAEMIVWGGNATFGPGARYGIVYPPATNAWATMSSPPFATDRANDIAVWTGTELIVWGGNEGNLVFLDTGARYRP